MTPKNKFILVLQSETSYKNSKQNFDKWYANKCKSYKFYTKE